MSQATLERKSEKIHGSNPVEINIHSLTAAVRERAFYRFLEESITISLVERQANNHFTFTANASNKHGHLGMTYQVEIYRAEDHKVYGRCNCIATTHCKHIEGSYLEAQSIVYMHTEICLACGKSFQTTDSLFCFECLTNPQEPDPAPALGVGQGQPTCRCCGRLGDPKLNLHGGTCPACQENKAHPIVAQSIQEIEEFIAESQARPDFDPEDQEIAFCLNCGSEFPSNELDITGNCIGCRAVDIWEEEKAIRNAQEGGRCKRCKHQAPELSAEGLCLNCDRSDLFG